MAAARGEQNTEQPLGFGRLPRKHHKHMQSTSMLERLMEEIKRRTPAVRIFPNAAACLRLAGALAVEMHEEWMQSARYWNMQPLAEQRKQALRGREEAA